MNDVLASIVADKRKHVGRCKAARSLIDLESLIPADPCRGFRKALLDANRRGQHALIGEIKKASPSKGLIRDDFDPPALARAYKVGGAACLSVLTDKPYFQGDDAFLWIAGEATNLPVLRKDFTIDPYQVVEARVLGADCILLIMAALSDGMARELLSAADEIGLDVLIEVHDRDELDRALNLEPDLLGINNRNLKTLEIRLAVFEELARFAPQSCLLVAESGIYSHHDITRMANAGAEAYLVGESLMRQADVAAATRALLGLAA